jgi:hypothetical protein
MKDNIVNLYETYIFNRKQILGKLRILHTRVNTDCKNINIQEYMVSSTIYMYDDYISKIDMREKSRIILDFLMVGAITCYWIVHKFEYDETLCAKKLKRLAGFSKYDYIYMEIHILNILNYNICKYMPGEHP